MSEGSEPNIYRSQSEQEKKPELLYRAFTVNPEELTVEMLLGALVPGKPSKEDPTKIHDGNELGVYMSTNRLMTEQAYASPSGGLSVKTPDHKDARGVFTNFIPLPQCGIVVEVRTENLPIRRPGITTALKGVHNNGYEGDEWIADQIPATEYRVVRLILSGYANDTEKLVVDVGENTKEVLEKAVEAIRAEFEKRKEKAIRYKEFLESLDSKERMNKFLLEKKWKEFEKN